MSETEENVTAAPVDDTAVAIEAGETATEALTLPYSFGDWTDEKYNTPVYVDESTSRNPTDIERVANWLADRLSKLEQLVLRNDANTTSAMGSMVRSVQTLAGTAMKAQDQVGRLTQLVAQLGQGINSMTSPQVLKVAITKDRPAFDDIEGKLTIVKIALTSDSHPRMPNFIEVLNNKPVDGVDHWDESIVSQELGIFMAASLKETGHAPGDWAWATLWMIPRPAGYLRGVQTGAIDEVPIGDMAAAA